MSQPPASCVSPGRTSELPLRSASPLPGLAARSCCTLLYDTLTWKDEHGVIPWLATRWDVSPDGQEYTFSLTPGVIWHDGQPLTAADVAFSFDYYARHPYRWTTTTVSSRAPPPVGSDQVRIRLHTPYAPFLEDIAGSVPILPEHIWSHVDKPETYGGPDASTGSGPFRLAEYRPADGAYRLLANPKYFRGPVLIAEFQQLNIPPETRVQALQRGEIDLAWSTDASVLDVFKGNSRLRVLETPPLSIVRLAVNTDQPPLDRIEIRQALIHALDRATLAQTITKAPPTVGSAGIVPPGKPVVCHGTARLPVRSGSRAFPAGRARP